MITARLLSPVINCDNYVYNDNDDDADDDDDDDDDDDKNHLNVKMCVIFGWLHIVCALLVLPIHIVIIHHHRRSIL